MDAYGRNRQKGLVVTRKMTRLGASMLIAIGQIFPAVRAGHSPIRFPGFRV